MAIFGFGKNKKEKGQAQTVRRDDVRYDGEPAGNQETPMEDLEIIYDEIIRKGNEAERTESGIVYPSAGLELSCIIQRVTGGQNGRYSVEMLFVMTHALFDEPLCEYTAGLGDSKEAAMRAGAEQFCGVVLLPVLSAFGCTEGSRVEAELDGRKIVFRRPCNNMIFSMGIQNPEAKDLWEIVEKEIPQYLGTKNAYWIKLYACSYDGELNCEARINGAVFPELTKKLDEYVLGWADRQNFHSEKEFLLLLREDSKAQSGQSSEAQDERSSEEVKAVTVQAVEALSAIVDEATEETAIKKLYVLSGGDRNFMWELQTFIPEIYTLFCLNLSSSDGMLLNRDGKETVAVKKSQIRNYGYIEQGIQRYMQEKNPDRDASLNVMCLSAVFSAVNQAVQKGSKVEDLHFPEMIYNVPEDYIIR